MVLVIVGSAYHKNTNAKAERAHGAIGDTLRADANGRKDDWDKQLTLAELAINGAASTLGGEADTTPFFIDRGAHPRLVLSAPHAESSSPITPRRSRRANMRSGRARSKRRRESCWRRRRRPARRSSTRVGSTRCSRWATACYSDAPDPVTKELLDEADIGKLRQRWDGPFTVSACPSPNAYTLELPRKMRCSPTVNVDRLKPLSSALTSRPLPARSLTRGRWANTMWTCSRPPEGAGGYRIPCPLGGPRRLAGRCLAVGGGAGQLQRPGGRVRCRPSGAGAGAGTRARSFISGPGGSRWCASAARCRAGTSCGLAGGWHRRGPVRPGASRPAGAVPLA